MSVVFTLLLCALGFFLYLADKNNHEISGLKNKLREKELETQKLPPQTLPPPKRFVSVVFKEGRSKLYDYFIGENYDLCVGDYVEVPVRNKFTGESELKIAIVKYVSYPGERSERAWATVIQKVTYQPPKAYIPPQPSVYTPQPVREVKQPYNQPKTQTFPSATKTSALGERFVQVIFKKGSKKRFDYLLGDNYDVRVGDFVVVHVNNNGKTTWKIAKVLYISSPGEISEHAKSEIIKKADYPKW